MFRNQNKWIGINQLLTIAIIHHERPDEIIANTVRINKKLIMKKVGVYKAATFNAQNG